MTEKIAARDDMRNEALYQDLSLATLCVVFQRNVNALYDRLARHTNRLWVSELTYEP
jgi:hypothetical protein